MKSFGLLILALNLVSTSSFARNIGSFKNKSCALITPREIAEPLISSLMEKGYRPVNSIDKTAYETTSGVNGSFESKTTSQLFSDSYFQGMPYLEMKVDVLRGVHFSELTIGIVGVSDMQKYSSSKTSMAADGDLAVFSAEDLPTCTED